MSSHPRGVDLTAFATGELRRRDSALRASESESDQFRILAENIPQIVWTANSDGSVDYFNARWLEYTGLNLEQTLGWGWRSVLHPDDLQVCIEKWQDAVDTGNAYEVEYRLERALDGAYRWHLVRALPIRNSQGVVDKWFGTCTDIDDQRAAQRALQDAHAVLTASVAARSAELAAANQTLFERAEQQRVSEERFRAAIAGMMDAFYVMDSVRDETGKIIDFRLVELNDAATRGLGRTREELTGRLQSELSDPKMLDFLIQAQAEVVESQRPLERELRIPELSHDKPGWIRQQLVPLGDGLVITARNTTEEKSHQRLLELHSAIVSHMSEGVCAVTVAEGLIVYANLKMEQMLGYEPGELEGKPAAQLYPSDPPGRYQLDQLIEELHRCGESTREIINVKKDGTRVQCRIAVATIVHPEHGPVWVTLREDITARKHAEEAVVRLATIVESTFEAVVSKSVSGVIDTWNGAAERLYGFSKKEAMGQSVALIVPPYLRDEERRMVARLGSGESIPPFDTVRIRRDGTLINVLVTVSAIRTESGALTGVSTIAHDISERKRVHEAMDRSLREKVVLLKEVHHRVKNNLQVISSLLKLHAERVTHADACAAFEDSQARVQAISLLHEKLYESKVLGSVDIGAYADTLIYALVRTYRAGAGDVAVELTTNGIHVGADQAVPLGLILNELLTNAFKHAFDRTAGARLHVTVRRTGGALELSVRDNGPGLPASFDQISPGSLGLKLVRMLSGQLRGYFRIQTENGTLASVTFPECSGEG